MDMKTDTNNEMHHGLNEKPSLHFKHDTHQAYGNYFHHYRSPFLGYGLIGPFSGGLLGGLAAGVLFGSYNGYGYGGYGGYPYYGGYGYPPYYYGGYGYPYWHHS